MDKETQDEIYKAVSPVIPATHYLEKAETGIICRSVKAKDRDRVFSITHGHGMYYLICWLGDKWYERDTNDLIVIVEAVRSNIKDWLVL